MERLLKALGILQERQRGEYRGFDRLETRLNPFNPLTYIILGIGVVLNTILYGVIGTIEELKRNPFKWK